LNQPLAETAWVQRARAGSADDFARLVAAHQAPLRAFLRRLTGNTAEADDLAQETFLLAWRQLARFETGRPFRPWLFGIGWRKFRESRRSWARLLRREQVVAQPEQAAADDADLRLDLGKALGALPANERAAALLCLANGFSHSEAADALEMPLGTVKSLVARAKDHLAAALGDSHGYA
jgi:RNA polymerase sigma factor (sigma-70 family)